MAARGCLRRRIIGNLPAGYAVYAEPYGGAASVMLNKPPHPCEVYNDLHGDLVNLFRCVQDEARFEKLAVRLEWTLYSRDEFALAIETLQTSNDPDERAWAFFTAQNQGFGGKAKSVGDWGRVFVSSRGMAYSASMWLSHIERLPAIRGGIICLANCSRPYCVNEVRWQNQLNLFVPSMQSKHW